MQEAVQKRLRGLPSVEELVGGLDAADLLVKYGRTQVVEAARAAIEAERAGIMSGVEQGDMDDTQSAARLLEKAIELLESWTRPGLCRTLNLTGIVIHTNLGRSRLAESAIARVAEVAGSYSNLEYDLKAGSRGNRETHVEKLLTRLTGAEAAFVVNNNAGAVLLLLMGLAAGREVVVSRGQLVEIGGSFRLPDIMRAGGVQLVEVGTTNRTHIGDFESAITGNTALLFQVHTSNYRIMGFAEEVGLEDLVELGRRRGVVVADDLGSGALLELGVFAGEPTVAASLRSGADVVCFSGDKLLGGPQAGIIVGRGEVVDRLRRHPVARALRLDKMTLAALEATLQLYADPERARREVPTLRLLERTPAETAALAARLQSTIEARCADGFILEIEESKARAGGGSMPLVELPSHAVRVRIPELPVECGMPGGTARSTGVAGGPGGSVAAEVPGMRTIKWSASALEAELRKAPVPVIARVSQDCLHLDVLALDDDEVEDVAESVAWAAARLLDRAERGLAPERDS